MKRLSGFVDAVLAGICIGAGGVIIPLCRKLRANE